MDEQEEMQEKLKNMSPEELRKFQKEQCIFCHIISGKVQSKKIYEDKKCLAILDIAPANPGHILLLPKEHYAIMPQIPDDILGHMSMLTKALSSACLKAFKASGTNIFIANGIVAGQKAQHFMIHIIPRMEKDNLNFSLSENSTNETDLIQLKQILTKKVNEIFGLKPEKEEGPQTKQETIQPLTEEEQKKEIDLDKISEKIQAPKPKKKSKKSLEKKKEIKKKSPKKTKKTKGANLDDIAKLFT